MDSFPADYSNVPEILRRASQPSPQSRTQTDFPTSFSNGVFGRQRGEYILGQADVPKPEWIPPVWMIQQHRGHGFPLSGAAGSGFKSPNTASQEHGPSSTADNNRPVPMQVLCDPNDKKQQQQPATLKTEGDNAPLSKFIAMTIPDNSNKSAMIIDNPPACTADSPRGNAIAKDTTNEADVKQMDSSDCSDHMDEQEDKCNSRTVSKNLVSERKRRKKLNEGLYTLRALVPRISKLDKASIIGDAIDYVRELQKEVEDLQTAISEVEGSRNSGNLATEESPQNAPMNDSSMVTEDFERASRSSTPRSSDDTITEQKILKLDVLKMEERSYHLRIFCTKGPGVFVQLMRSLEALGMEVLSANLTSFEENILNTFIAEIKDLEAMKTEEVKAAILEVAARFGLQT